MMMIKVKAHLEVE